MIIYQIKVVARTIDVTEQKVKVGVLAGVVPLGIGFYEKARVEGKVESGSHDIGLELLGSGCDYSVSPTTVGSSFSICYPGQIRPCDLDK